MEKHSVSRLSYLFAHLYLLSSDSFSSHLLSSNLPLLSASPLLCFSSVHIVGSLTSKLPSIILYVEKQFLTFKVVTFAPVSLELLWSIAFGTCSAAWTHGIMNQPRLQSKGLDRYEPSWKNLVKFGKSSWKNHIIYHISYIIYHFQISFNLW